MSPPLELRDIHLPDAIGWWPPAIGWWLLLVLIPLTCWMVVWLYKRITRKTAVKTAKKILAEIKSNQQKDMDKLIALSALIRRVAISLSPRADTASLTGKAWLAYLDSSVQGTPFTDGKGQILADIHYRKNTDIDLEIDAVITLCENWLNVQKQAKQ